MAPVSLGVTFPPLETRREVILETALKAEALGYEAFFVAEAWGLDATVLLAEIATKTERITLGTAVLNAWTRSAATLAMAAAGLSELSGGRFVLGLGAGTRELAEGLHDVAYAAPGERLRRVTAQVRELTSGGRVPLSPGNTARPLRLAVGPADVPVYLAGLAPASIRLAGELADGWIPFFVPFDGMDDALGRLEEGRARRVDERGGCRICPVLGAAVAEDEAGAREVAAWWVAFYLTTMGTLYAKTLQRGGFGAEVAAVLAANPTRPATVSPPRRRPCSISSSCSGRRNRPAGASSAGGAPGTGSRSCPCRPTGRRRRSTWPCGRWPQPVHRLARSAREAPDPGRVTYCTQCHWWVPHLRRRSAAPRRVRRPGSLPGGPGALPHRGRGPGPAAAGWRRGGGGDGLRGGVLRAGGAGLREGRVARPAPGRRRPGLILHSVPLWHSVTTICPVRDAGWDHRAGPGVHQHTVGGQR